MIFVNDDAASVGRSRRGKKRCAVAHPLFVAARAALLTHLAFAEIAVPSIARLSLLEPSISRPAIMQVQLLFIHLIDHCNRVPRRTRLDLIAGYVELDLAR